MVIGCSQFAQAQFYWWLLCQNGFAIFVFNDSDWDDDDGDIKGLWCYDDDDDDDDADDDDHLNLATLVRRVGWSSSEPTSFIVGKSFKCSNGENSSKQTAILFKHQFQKMLCYRCFSLCIHWPCFTIGANSSSRKLKEKVGLGFKFILCVYFLKPPNIYWSTVSKQITDCLQLRDTYSRTK